MTAIYKREMHSYFYGMTGYVFSAFLLVFAGIFTMIYNLKAGYPNFEYVVSNLGLVLFVAIPILTMRTIAEERRQKTDQLLYALPLGMTKIVLGKYLAVLTTAALPCLVMCLYPLMLSSFGSVEMRTALGAILGFFLMSAALASIGMFISSLCENQAVAAGVTCAVMLLLYSMADLAGYVPDSPAASLLALAIVVLLLSAAVRFMTKSRAAAIIFGALGIAALTAAYLLYQDSFSGLFGKIADSLSVFERFYTIIDGIFDLTAVVYFISVSCVALFLTVQTMEKRRWS